MDGDWACSDLLATLELFLKNRGVMGDLDGGVGCVFKKADVTGTALAQSGHASAK